MEPLTFTRFSDGRTYTDDLLHDCPQAIDCVAGTPGYIYPGGTYIVEATDPDGQPTGEFVLSIANCGYQSHNRLDLEAILYGWCLAEMPEEMGMEPGGDVHRFICELQARTTTAEFAQALLRNFDEANPSVDHLHDVCDANEAVMAAIESVQHDSFTLERGDALWAKAAPFLRGRIAMSHFAVIGRVPGDEEDSCFTMLAESREHAVEQFTRRVQADFTRDALEDIRSTMGEDCFVSFVLRSDSQIEEVNTRPASAFSRGEQVWWTDPDFGLSSGIYTIIREPESLAPDTVVVLQNVDGAEAEVPLHEIRPLTEDDRKNA